VTVLQPTVELMDVCSQVGTTYMLVMKAQTKAGVSSGAWAESKITCP